MCFCRPMDSLEHLLLVGPDQCVPQQFSSTPFLSEDANTCADLLRVLSVLVSLENCQMRLRQHLNGSCTN